MVPTALQFREPADEIVLPSDAYGGEILALTIDGNTPAEIVLDIKKNLNALAGLCSFVMVCSRRNISSQFSNLQLLATLPSLRPFSSRVMVDGDGCA